MVQLVLILSLALRFLETDCMASLHFGSLCCRARGMSLNGYLRCDQHVWHLSKCLSTIVLVVLDVTQWFLSQ